MEQRRVFAQVLTVETVIASVVFLLVLTALLYSLIRRRAGAGVGPSPRSERPRLEVSYLAALVVIAAGLVVYTASANDWMHPGGDAQAAGRGGGKAAPVEVDVTAFQWCWKFTHPAPGAHQAARSGHGPDARPAADAHHAAEAHHAADGGHGSGGAHGQRSDGARAATTTANCRDGRLPTLVVPTGRTVRINLTSLDVIHSLWVPALRYKMDAFPDHTNSFTFTVDKEGRWIGRCAEFCGDRHHAMEFWLKAVSPEEYDDWVSQHQQDGPTGGAAA
ncbi:cytochrome c oxidase subunit II [Streptomyces diacarni]|uniref:cytochrome c oxidase subunit II n=1 Tax=Streptomyces diacarni TaxID=2800381 RepID=UPI001FE650D9|nr:cytochrome c oxidase subunit II [Streptomyces diacarni]